MRLIRSSRTFSTTLKMTMIGLLCASLVACSDDAERPETITKLRALGVAQTPTTAKPGDQVTLTFYLAGQPQLKITAQPALDSMARFGQPVAVTPVDQAPSETTVGPLSLYTYRVSLTAASDAATTAAIQTKGLARLRYKVNFSTDVGDGESIVGDTLVYPPGSPQLEWQPPTISIDKPVQEAASGSMALEGTVNSNGKETNRVGWFVSAGKIKNRKSRSTEWQDAPQGTQAVFFTVRGAKSGAFAIKSQAVTVN
jgi:hypothetical protein